MKVGDKIHSDRLGLCVIVRVHPLGTVDVVTKSGRYFRISGLPLKSSV